MEKFFKKYFKYFSKVVLVFVDIRGEPTEAERDQITVLWEGMMINAHNIEAKRFPIKNDRVIFQLARGEQVRELAQLLRQQVEFLRESVVIGRLRVVYNSAHRYPRMLKFSHKLLLTLTKTFFKTDF